MLEKVWATISENRLILPGELVIVGVSGGPDSLALLHALSILSKRGNFSLHTAHLNHSFRGQEADDEAMWVKKTSESWGIPCTVIKEDVPAIAKKEGLSPQEAGHRVRKEFFLTLLHRLKAQKIALGQQADDQAETILMHLLSGAGSEGLQGIRLASFPFIRPLLFITRQEIEEYCRLNGLEPRQDPSNSKNIYLRNRIRNQLMPWLKENINPNLVASLQKTAAILQSEEDYWRELVAEFAREHIKREESGDVKLVLAAFNGQPVALQRRIIRTVCQEITGEQGLAFFHVEEIRKLALQGQVGKRLDLPGELLVVRDYRELLFTLNYQEQPNGGIQPRKLKIPGKVLVPETGQLITATIRSEKPEAGVNRVWLPLEDHEMPDLCCRSRQTGDWLTPLGMTGRKKLKEFFIDRKVPRPMRERLLLIAMGKEVIWIPGLAVSNRMKGESPVNRYLVLEIEELPGTDRGREPKP